MAVGNFTSNQGTQTPLLTDNTGGASGTQIPVMKISTDGQGTFTNGGLWNGHVTQDAGTVSAGTINNATINAGTFNSGTVNLGTVVGKDANAAAQTGNPIGVGGTDSGGTIRTLKVDSSGLGHALVETGTVNTGTINTGTINSGTFNAGTVNLGTFVWKDANAAAQTGNPIGVGGTDSGGTIRTWKVDSSGLGHVNMEIGTISSLPNLPGGTLNLGTSQMSSGTLNVGTVNTGTVNTGTINTGTINAATVNASTVNAGTINTGTFRQDARTTQNIVSFATQVAFTGAAAATIVGSASVGAGTSLWMNDVSLFNMQSGAGTFILGFGTAQQGTNVLLRAPIGTNSAVGIEKPYPKAVNAGMTNQDLVLSATGAGTVDLSISYFISA